MDVGLACLLLGAEVSPDLDVDASLRRLDELAAAAVLPSRALPDVAAALRQVLGAFAGSPEDFDDLRSSLLHEVLVRRRGLPILLTVVWLEVARRLDVPAYAALLPGRVVVGLGDPEDEHVLLDPFSGGTPLEKADLPVLPPVDLLLRVLTNVRVLTTRQDRSLDAARTRLWAVELSLLLPRHPLALRRERGELLVRLGDHLGGAEALEDYALLVDDVDAEEAETVRREARQARARLN